MTREGEIKERVKTCNVYYVYEGRTVGDADDDMLHLLARNEELQRRVAELESLGRSLYLTSRNHPDWTGCRIVDAEKLKPFQPIWVGNGDAADAEEK